jgi:hypothetical protein
MQVKTTSGSGAAGLGVIGTGLALALPDAKWIGWLLVAMGLLVFLFDIRIERGQIRAGGSRLHQFGPWVLIIGGPLLGAAWLYFQSAPISDSNDGQLSSIEALRNLKAIKKLSLIDIPVVDISVLLELPALISVTVIRVPARADVITELERRGVKVN